MEMTKLISTLLLTAGLSACGMEPTDEPLESQGEALINANRLPANLYTSALVWTTGNYRSGAGGFLCSGTVVGPHHILTAAHCVTTVRIQTRSYQGQQYQADIFFPAVAPELAGANAVIAVSNERDLPNNIERPIWKRLHVRSVLRPPQFVEACRAHPEYYELLYNASPDVAVLEVAENVAATFPGVRAAQVDTRHLAQGSVATLTGYGCEDETIDASGNYVTNWGKRVTAEYKKSSTLTPREATAYEKAAYPEEKRSDLMDFNRHLAEGYYSLPGPGARPRRPGLCAGDSGGGLFRGGDQGLVVGVGSGGELGGGPNPTNLLGWYTRLDRVGPWLSRVLPQSSVVN